MIIANILQISSRSFFIGDLQSTGFEKFYMFLYRQWRFCIWLSIHNKKRPTKCAYRETRQRPGRLITNNIQKIEIFVKAKSRKMWFSCFSRRIAGKVADYMVLITINLASFYWSRLIFIAPERVAFFIKRGTFALRSRLRFYNLRARKFIFK